MLIESVVKLSHILTNVLLQTRSLVLRNIGTVNRSVDVIMMAVLNFSTSRFLNYRRTTKIVRLLVDELTLKALEVL